MMEIKDYYSEKLKDIKKSIDSLDIKIDSFIDKHHELDKKVVKNKVYISITYGILVVLVTKVVLGFIK